MKKDATPIQGGVLKDVIDQINHLNLLFQLELCT